MGDFTLNNDDTALLRQYLDELDALNEREPEKLPAETWDAAWPEIQRTGEVPAEYADRIGKRQTTDKITGETRPGYYDIVWESWNTERAQLDSKYPSQMSTVILGPLQKSALFIGSFSVDLCGVS